MKANPERPITLTFACGGCDHTEDITMKFKDHAAWRGGTPIQEVLGYLTPGQRELMKTRTCGPCFDQLNVMVPETFDPFKGMEVEKVEEVEKNAS